MKLILVLVDTTEASQQRIAVAAEYAAKMGAHLSGLFVIPEVKFPKYVENVLRKSAFKRLEEGFADQIEVAKSEFMAATTQVEGGVSWIAETGNISDVLLGYSRCADMIVLGQHDADQDDSSVLVEPDQIILRSGRPGLVVPYVKIPMQRLGKKAVIAWNGSREAARALHDAMPLLKLAQQVEVCAITEPKTVAATFAKLERIKEYLAKHEIDATIVRIPKTDLSVGAELLNHLVDSGADLLVTGAYGHKRLREIVLGGVTRDLLEHSSIPVLMSR